MAAAETARLIASLELKDNLSKGIKSATASIGGLEGRLGRIGGIAQQGVSSAIGNIARLGLVAGAGIGAAIKTGLDDLAELENATTSVEGAIAQLGLTGQLTGQQVAGWANEIEAATGAAFDDKAIVQATTTLLRFGKVTPGNLRQTLVVMTDLATKTGSVDSAAELLAKALADPTKAAGKLSRQGIILTKVQQEQIKAFVEGGDSAKAQALLLDLLAKSTAGAAAASQGPYQRALSVLGDVSEDTRKALAEGFLPVLEKLSAKLSAGLGDPKIMAQVREFGKGLAGALDSLIDIGEKLPWATIGDSLKVAGAGARTLLQAFTSLPPWLQTAVITGWGLNKLTGGALGGVIGELGKGLIKGVLGMQAGVVNITAATVNGVGVPGAVPGKGGPANLLPAIGVAGLITALAVPVGEAFAAALPPELKGPGGTGQSESQRRIAEGLAEMARKNGESKVVLNSIDKETRDAAAASRAGALAMQGVSSAIAVQKPPIVNLDIDVDITAGGIEKRVTIQNRAGPAGGSRETSKRFET